MLLFVVIDTLSHFLKRSNTRTLVGGYAVVAFPDGSARWTLAAINACFRAAHMLLFTRGYAERASSALAPNTTSVTP